MNQTNAIIECQQLAKHFAGKQVLQDVSFTMHAGDTVALIGPNGAGKTTLFSILCGYIKQSRGNVRIMGHTPGSSALFGRVSALPQDAQFDPGFSIGEQLVFYARLQGISGKAAKTEVQRVLALVDLAEQFASPASALSHGMRKRAAIAQAFIGNPALVLLDEPTAGLDPVNALHIRQLISRLSGDVSFMISSHNIFELEQLCNKVLYLEKGVLQMQAGATDAAAEQHLTVQLTDASAEQVIPTLKQLPGLINITSNSKRELELSYHPQNAAEFDIQVLQCLAANGWQYRSLTKGKTLEQKLFNVAG